MADQTGIYELTAPALQFYPKLLKAEAFKRKGKDQGDPKFSITLGLVASHLDLEPMKRMAAQVARAQFPTEPFANLAFPFASGDKEADKAVAKAAAEGKGKPNVDFLRGKVLVTARTGEQYPPKLAVIVNGEIVGLDTPELLKLHGAKLFFGEEVFAKIKFKAHEAVGNNPAGVNVYLLGVLGTGKGDRIGSQTAQQMFANYRGKVSAEDPIGPGNADDQIPF